MSAVDILLWLGETSLAISVLVFAILLIRKPIANMFGAGAAYTLWLIPLVRLFLPELEILTPPETLADTASFYASPAIFTNTAPVYDVGSLIASALILLWAMVAIAWIYLRLEAQSKYARNAFAHSTEAPLPLQELARDIASELGIRRHFEIRVTEKEQGPAVFGIFKPTILLPANFDASYSFEERKLALAHELSHIKRGDMFAAFLALIFQASQWPNPLIHYALRAFRTDQEAACDAFVLKRTNLSRRAEGDYASAILKSARQGQQSYAFGLSLGHPVKERLMLLRNKKRSVAHKVLGAATVSVFAAVGIAGTASYGYAADKDEKKDVKVLKKKNVRVTTDANGNRKERTVVIVGGENVADAEITALDGDNVWISAEGDDNVWITDDGDEHRVMSISRYGDEGESMFVGDCVTPEGKDGPVKLEWKDEDKSKKGETSISHTIICLSGDDASADPKERAKLLRDAIDRMEANAKKDEERRKKMIDGLRKQLRELEKKN